MLQHWQMHSLVYINILHLTLCLTDMLNTAAKSLIPITDPVSSSNFTRVMQIPPEKAEDDEFFKRSIVSAFAEENAHVGILGGGEDRGIESILFRTDNVQRDSPAIVSVDT